MDAQLLFDAFQYGLRLKEAPRTGWNSESHGKVTRVVPGAESVADHSWGVAYLVYLLSVLKPDLEVDGQRVNWAKAQLMAILHDSPEVLTGDDNSVYAGAPEHAQANKERKAVRDREAIAEMRQRFGERLGGDMCALIEERERKETPEARLVSECDATDVALQSLPYSLRPDTTIIAREWVEVSRAKITIPILIELFDNIVAPLLPPAAV